MGINNSTLFKFDSRVLFLLVNSLYGLRVIDTRQYAPDFPYEKLDQLKNYEINKYAWALSTKLLPPPMADDTEEAADDLYLPYYYATEDNADMFYQPYLQQQEDQPEADDYYLPYLHQDPWVTYYGGLPTLDNSERYVGPVETEDLRTHAQDVKYEGLMAYPELPKL